MKHVVNQTVEGSAAFDFCWSRSAAAGCPTLSSPGAVGWRCPNPSNVPWPRLWSESLWQRPSRSKAPSASCPWGATSVVVAQNGGAWAAAVCGSTWGTKVGHDDPCGSLPAWSSMVPRRAPSSCEPDFFLFRRCERAGVGMRNCRFPLACFQVCAGKYGFCQCPLSPTSETKKSGLVCWVCCCWHYLLCS